MTVLFAVRPSLVDPAGLLTTLSLDPPGLVATVDLGYPVVRQAVADRALTSGTVDLTAFAGARAVTIDVQVNGSETGGHPTLTTGQLVEQLASWMRPDLRPRLTFRRAHDGALRRIDLRPNDMAVDNPWEDIGWVRVQLGFVAPSGLVEADSASTAAVTGGTGSTTASNGGSALVFPTVRVTGPITNPVVANSTTGRQFKLSATIPAGQWVDVDMVNRTVLRDNGANWRQYVDASVSTWWWLRPGSNTVALSGSSTSGATRMDVTWRDGWVW